MDAMEVVEVMAVPAVENQLLLLACSSRLEKASTGLKGNLLQVAEEKLWWIQSVPGRERGAGIWRSSPRLRLKVGGSALAWKEFMRSPIISHHLPSSPILIILIILALVWHWGWKPFYHGHFSHSDVTCPHCQMQLESSEIRQHVASSTGEFTVNGRNVKYRNQW